MVSTPSAPEPVPGSDTAADSALAPESASSTARELSLEEEVLAEHLNTGPESEPEREKTAEYTLAFVGDVHVADQLQALLSQPETALSPIAATLSAADFTMVNLETAITERGSAQSKAFTFRTSPAALDVLADAGVDAVSAANNHGADYGAAGFEDTIAAGRQGPIPVLGMGNTRAEAATPHIVDIGGNSVAVFARFRHGRPAGGNDRNVWMSFGEGVSSQWMIYRYKIRSWTGVGALVGKVRPDAQDSPRRPFR